MCERRLSCWRPGSARGSVSGYGVRHVRGPAVTTISGLPTKLTSPWQLLHTGARAPVANLQQKTAATKAQPGGGGCDYSWLTRHEQRSATPAPPLCKQVVSPCTCPISGLGPCRAADPVRPFGRVSVGGTQVPARRPTHAL